MTRHIEVWLAKGDLNILVTMKIPVELEPEKAEQLSKDVTSAIKRRMKGWSKVDVEMKLMLTGEISSNED